jgi:cytochrome c biogenesis protein CcmG, thiol:disulfide interchange protein DsbE
MRTTLAALALVTTLAAGLALEDRWRQPAWAGPPDDMESLPGIRSPASARAVNVDAPAIVHVFAATCPSCRGELPTLERLAREAPVPLIGLDVGDEPGDVGRWLVHYGNPYDAVFSDRDGKVAAAIGVRILPATFVIDAGRRVVARLDGPLTHERVPALLRALHRGPAGDSRRPD